ELAPRLPPGRGAVPRGDRRGPAGRVEHGRAGRGGGVESRVRRLAAEAGGGGLRAGAREGGGARKGKLGRSAVWGLCALVAVCLARALAAPVKPTPGDGPEVRSLQEKRRDLLKKVADLEVAKHRSGAGSLWACLVSYHELLQAEMELAKTRA